MSLYQVEMAWSKYNLLKARGSNVPLVLGETRNLKLELLSKLELL